MKAFAAISRLAIAIAGLSLVTGQALGGWDEEGVAKGWKLIHDSETKSMEDKHEALRGLIGGLGPWAPYGGQSEYKNGAVRNKEQEELFLAARDLMTSTPGHAEYYGQRIRKWRAYAQKYSGTGAYTNYMNDRRRLLQVLEHLPSPETARVMAGFLDDEYEEFEQGISLGAPNMVKAAQVLVSILDNPPTTEIFRTSVWRQWRDEVEAGQTTFRLKGIEGEFNFQGPAEAKKSRVPKTHAVAQGDPSPSKSVQHREPNAVDLGTENGTAQEGHEAWWISVGAIALLASLVYWWGIRAKPRNRSESN